jgi:hypothetical protein
MTGRGATTTALGATTTGRAATHPARTTPTAQTTALASVVVKATAPSTRSTGIRFFIADNFLSFFVTIEKLWLFALGFRCCDGLFDLGLQIAYVEVGSGLHRRILDEAGNILSNNLARNLEPPHLMFKRVPIAD